MVHSSAQLWQFSCEWLTLHAAVANPAPKRMAMTTSEAVLGDTNPCCRASQPHQERSPPEVQGLAGPSPALQHLGLGSRGFGCA